MCSAPAYHARPSLLGRGLCSGALIGLTPGVHGCGYAIRLIADQALSPLHKLFPLRAPTIDHFTATIDVVTELLLAPVDQRTHLLGSLPALRSQILGSFTSSLSDVLTRFATALGRIQNPNQGANTNSSQEPG